MPITDTIPNLLLQLGRRYGTSLIAVSGLLDTDDGPRASIAYRERGKDTYAVETVVMTEGHIAALTQMSRWGLTRDQAITHPTILRRVVA